VSYDVKINITENTVEIGQVGSETNFLYISFDDWNHLLQILNDADRFMPETGVKDRLMR